MVSTTFEILKKAREQGYAVGSFNTSNVDVLRAILEAAAELHAPVMVETSEGEIAFDGPKVLAAAFGALIKDLKIPAVLHLDHGHRLSVIEAAINAGYTSVHIDASLLPYADNLLLTQKVVSLAHSRGLFVEGELGHVPGTSEAHGLKIAEVVGRLEKTDPDQAAAFVAATGIDCLAASLGNVHGLYADAKKLDIELIKKLRAKVDCFLSLHGASGIDALMIRSAVAAGINKINVNTELRAAYIGALRREMDQAREEIKPYRIFPPALAAVKEVVKQKITIFGSRGRASL